MHLKNGTAAQSTMMNALSLVQGGCIIHCFRSNLTVFASEASWRIAKIIIDQNVLFLMSRFN